MTFIRFGELSPGDTFTFGGRACVKIQPYDHYGMTVNFIQADGVPLVGTSPDDAEVELP